MNLAGESSKFAESRYNHFIYIEDKKQYLVYNAISNGLAALEPEVFELLKDGRQGIARLEKDNSRRDLIQKLYKGNIIVDSDFDEIEFLRTRFNMSKYGQKHLSLTIATTLDCNLNCHYCYQRDRSVKYPDETLEDDIIKFTEKRIDSIGYRGLHITWYGGEPLMNKEFIFSLSKKLMALCKRENVRYSAMLVTNGTLLNQTIARRLKSLKVGSMQITIDGPSKIHDSRRPFKDKKRSSYHTIIKNIDRILGIIHIQVRINVDKTNFAGTLELLDEFDKKGWLNKPESIFFYIGYTRDWTPSCSNILQNCFSMREFSEAEIDFQKMLIDKGYRIGNLYPSPTGYCVAVSPHGFVIDPGGELHKCWSDVGNREAYFGHIREPLEFNGKLMQWLRYDPLAQFPECRECTLFPICGGGCPYVPIKQPQKLENEREYNCTPWKILMKEKIELFLQEKAKELK